MTTSSMPTPIRHPSQPPSARLRWRALSRFEDRIEPLMAILGLVWLGLFVVDMTRGLDPLLAGLSTTIWVVFVVDFALRLLLAPERLTYLRRNWLTALSLIVPAFRIGRFGVVARSLK